MGAYTSKPYTLCDHMPQFYRKFSASKFYFYLNTYTIFSVLIKPEGFNLKKNCKTSSFTRNTNTTHPCSSKNKN